MSLFLDVIRTNKNLRMEKKLTSVVSNAHTLAMFTSQFSLTLPGGYLAEQINYHKVIIKWL